MIEETLRNIVREELDHKFRELEDKKEVKEHYLNCEELATLWHCEVQKIRYLFHTKKLVGAKIGHNIIFRKSDVDNYFEKHKNNNNKIIEIRGEHKL